MTNKKSAAKLEIRFHLSDGSIEHFYQSDDAAAAKLIDDLQPGQLFKQPRILIAGDYSITAYVPGHVSKIDFISKDFVCWEFPVNLSDVVEISETLFRKQLRLAEPGAKPPQKRVQPRVTGDPFVAFVDLEMKGARHVYLMLEGANLPPSERFARLQFLLSGVNFHARLPAGGMAILNLANLVRFTVYPGPPVVPIDAWPAHHHLD